MRTGHCTLRINGNVSLLAKLVTRTHTHPDRQHVLNVRFGHVRMEDHDRVCFVRLVLSFVCDQEKRYMDGVLHLRYTSDSLFSVWYVYV